MKNKTVLILIFCLAISLFSNGQNLSYADPLTAQRALEINADFKGLWVATVLNLDYPMKATTDSEILKSEAIKIIEDAKAMGLNAIVLQVRPSADALYNSAINPWSKYLTGKQGLAPSDNFDPLEFWIEEAHKRGIAVHAWMNPYRITKKTAKEPSFDYSQLSANHPAILHPEWVVEYSDGNLYFNPGVPEARQNIVDSVTEIIENYNVDGIHFDDYFYPGTNFNDADTYAKYGGAFSSIGDWRRDNNTQLINSVYRAIKVKDNTIQFGISPFGIWANAKSIATGSQTNGYESYFSQYADTKKWTEEHLIDYIAPQLYWNIGYSIADYSKLLSWWSDVAKDSKVNLYIGHAAYRVGNSDSNSPWYGVNEIYKQLALNKNYSNVTGSIFFRYGFFKNNIALKTLVSDFYDGSIETPVQEKLIVGRPVKDVSTTSGYYFIGGASDPRYPVYLNGNEIKIKTSQGYYGVYMPLSKGVNTFVIKQNGKSVTRKITRTSPLLASPMAKVEIIPGSAWPQTVRMIKNSEWITFSCRAPIGAVVTATLNGKVYPLKPYTLTSTSKYNYSTTYSLKTQLPVQKGTPRIVDLGKPVYKMNFKGLGYSAVAKFPIKVALEGAPYVATISNDFVDSYESATTSNGAHFILHRGMTDYVTGESGDYVRMSSNLWVKRANVDLSNTNLKTNFIRKVSYIKDVKADEIHFSMNEKVVSSVAYDGAKLIVTFNQTTAGLALELPSNPMLLSAINKTNIKTTTYEFALKDPTQLAGYYLEDIAGGVKLVMRKKFVVYSNSATLPLKGAIIMLDPGHGGTDSGAIGLLGVIKPEKLIVGDHATMLKNKLEALGAIVVMTRPDDVYVSLNTRLEMSRKILPDLYISIHADSLADSSNLSKVSGFSIFYKDKLARSFAELVKTNIATNLQRTNRGAKVMNFYVVRGTWSPSILIEAGFMPNPAEFQWLNDPYEQDRFTQNISDSILQYFSNN